MLSSCHKAARVLLVSTRVDTSAKQAAAVPRCLANAPTLKLSENERVLLRLIDGRSTVGDIGLLLGLATEDIWRLLSHLARRGAIELPGYAHTPPPAADERSSAPKCDLPLELQREVDQLYSELRGLDAYALLRCQRGSSLEQVKAAYKERLMLLHPDRWYGKELGEYRYKLEAVSNRTTQAYEVLSKHLQRTQQVAAGAERVSTPNPEDSEPSGAHSATHMRAARPAPGHPSSEARLRALRRSLSQPSVRAQRTGAQRPGSSAQQRAVKAPDASAVSGVSARVRVSKMPPAGGGGSGQVEHYLQVADGALAEGDLASAVNGLKIALSVCPHDVALQAKLAEVERELSVKHGDEYLARARSAEQHGDFKEAARYYEKASVGQPSNARLKERAASCFVECDEAKKAVGLAKTAVLVAPRSTEYKLTLARAYAAAGMQKSARGELKRVLELDKNNAKAKALLKSL